jgi:hypothetical protein
MIPGNANPLLLASAAADAAAAGPTKSLRFNGNGNDDPYLERTVSSASNRRTFTFAAWVKNDVKTSNHDRIFSAGTSSSNIFDITLSADSEGTHLRIYNKTTTVHTNWNTVNKFRDPAAWFHVVCAIDTTQATQANRVKVYINGTHITDNGTTNTLPSQNAQMAVNDAVTHYIGRSGVYGDDRFAGYLADIYFIDGSQLEPTSFGAYDDNGVWQAAAYSGTFGTEGFHLLDFENESTLGHDSSGNENDFTAYNFRTANASGGAPTVTGTGPGFPAESTAIANLWDGAVANYPGDFLTAADGGVITISWPTAITGVTSIQYYSFNGSDRHNVNEGGWSGNSGSGAGYKSAYSGSAINLTKLQLQKNDQASFVKIGAIKINGTILTTSNYQSDSDTTDIYFDVPTNGTQSDTGVGGEVSGNYCTWNPLVGRHNDSGQSGTAPTFSNGNLNVSGGQTNDRIAGTFNFNVGQSGKYYWEVTFTGTPASSNGAGVRDYSAGTSTQVLKFWYYDGSTVDGGPATSFTTGDVLGFALDLSAGTIDCYKNGGSSVGQMDISSLTSVTPFVSTNSGVGVVGNFGQRAFAYSAPSGYKALCTTNLPTPTIADGSDYFDAKLWTGDGNTGRDITSYSFSPDWVWIKQRSATRAHALFDTVRGAGKRLQSSSNGAETTHTDQLSAFLSNGFTIEDKNTVNVSSGTYVGWAWDAGSSTASNTDGSVTAQVRANQSAGFSIVTFTNPSSGAFTVGHGLNAQVALVFMKHRGRAGDWLTWFSGFSKSEYLVLNSTAAKASATEVWGSSAPGSSTFGGKIGVSALAGDTDVAYCFAPVAGYSAFGSYTGNGSSTDGPFVHTGFRPSLIILKPSSRTGNWTLFDTARDTSNVANSRLHANLTDAEATSNTIDILSNGFKLYRAGLTENSSTETYIYAAFAENPFQANGGLAR